MWRYALAVSFLVSGVAFADNTLEVNPVTKKLDLVLDNSSAGVITGITATFTGYDCTLNSNGGALTTDSAGNLRCSDDDTGGGGGNSFETIAVPAGASVVADSSTDTLTLTETTFLTFTGTAATDTIDITQVTTDIGTDGLIAANAVALGTDTTNAYVADLAAGTYIDVSGGGAETATVTVTHDPTEMEAVTFGAGGNASNVWTNNLSGTDPTLTWGSALVTIGGALTSTGTITGVAGTFSGLLTGNAHLQVGNGATTAGIIAIREDTDAGTNEATFTVPALVADTDYTLPADDGTDATTELLTTNGAGTLDWITCAILTGSADLCDGTDATGAGGGDPVLVNTTAVADAAGVDITDGDLDWTLNAGVSPDTLTATVACTGCVDATDLASASVAAAELASGALPPRVIWIPCAAMLPLEAADSIPPLTKDAGTNIDQLACSFDAAVDEGRTGNFLVNGRIEAGSTVTFTVVWYSLAATTGAAVWNIRHNSGTAADVDPDVALTTLTATDTTAGTAGQASQTAITETQTNLAWVSGDLVYLTLHRDANNAADTLAGDALVVGLSISMPQL